MSKIPDHVPKKWPKPAAEFKVPLYFGRVYVFRDADAYNQAYHFVAHKPNEWPALPGVGGQHTLMERAGQYLVLVYASDLSALVHELSHAAFQILEMAKVPVAPKTNEEAFCYLLDNLFSLALPAWKLSEHGKPLKKRKRK